MSEQALRVGIDACNIRRGGGLTHLIQLLDAAEPSRDGIGEVLVWSRSEVLDRLPDRPWLRRCRLPALEGSLPRRMFWQQRRLSGVLRSTGCDVLFAPGGLLPTRVGMPTVTMSRNMLPFEPDEANRYGILSPLWLKMWVLRRGQVGSMRRADGLIFLTDYARHHVTQALGKEVRAVRTIPHGLADRFFQAPRSATPPGAFGPNRPFRVLYVSTVDMYKHQWQVVRAVAALRKAGIPARLDLIGSPVPKALQKLTAEIAEVDPDGDFVTYHGAVAFEQLHRHYQGSDVFVFASSCENLPNILLEAMAAGLPIACSHMGPMPEVLGDTGVYFDPLNAGSIALALRTLFEDETLRGQMAAAAHERARGYSWERCAAETFEFVAGVARRDYASS